MQILLDTANTQEILEMSKYFPLDGVTTNPTIIAKEKKDFFKLLQEIRDIIGEEKMLHVQVISEDAEGIISEAEYLREKISGNLYIKIPVTPEGIKAMQVLKNKGTNITATAIVSPQQALLAAKAGADYLAPYINRMDNIIADGINVANEIRTLLDVHEFNCKIIAASFKNVEQIHRCSLLGCEAVTINSDLLEKMIFHPVTDWSIAKFSQDWDEAYPGITNLIQLK